MPIKLRYDSRDKVFHQRFGSILEFPKEVNFDRPLYDDIQPIGDVKCTCYTTCDIAEDQDGIEYDINDLWKRIPQTPQGADPRDALGEAVKNGLLPETKTERVKHWKSYWRGDIGPSDAFDNLRSAMLLAQSPVAICSYWYKEWFDTDFLPVGKNPLSSHMYDAQGWREINGEPYLVIEAWIGRKLFMNRATFNAAMKPYGMQTWVLSTSEIDVKRTRTLIEWIKDAILNLIIKLKQQQIAIMQQSPVSTPQTPVIAPQPQPEPVIAPHGSYLLEWAAAIRDYEGKPGDLSYRNNNPGNLRYLNGDFVKFKTWEDGWNALLDYLTRAATGKHPAYKPEMMLLNQAYISPEKTPKVLPGFFQVYAPSLDRNNPKAYAQYVAKRIGVPIETQIKNLV